MTAAPTDLATLAAAPTRMEIAGRAIAVAPIRVRELPAFAAALEPLLTDLAAGLGVPEILARHAEALITATAIGARVERAWLDEQEADALIELAAAVLEVNADFFVRRILPGLTAASERLSGRLTGLPSTPASAPPG
jgi:hypothetical protein